MQIDDGLGVDDVDEGQLLKHEDSHSSGQLALGMNKEFEGWSTTIISC